MKPLPVMNTLRMAALFALRWSDGHPSPPYRITMLEGLTTVGSAVAVLQGAEVPAFCSAMTKPARDLPTGPEYHSFSEVAVVARLRRERFATAGARRDLKSTGAGRARLASRFASGRMERVKRSLFMMSSLSN